MKESYNTYFIQYIDNYKQFIYKKCFQISLKKQLRSGFFQLIVIPKKPDN